ncbi:MAG: hypothetical protein AB7E24_25120 [Novosphingobium sp.]
MLQDVTNTSQESEIERVEQALRRLQVKLPGVLRYRFESTLDHLDRAFTLFEIDREMASFRAITAEEEAATALIRCIQLRRYNFSNKFNPRHHQHKAAVMACVMAVGSTLQPMLKNFQLIFDFSLPRIDLQVPLSNFGVAGGDKYALQFVEPLDLVHTREGISETELFDDALRGLAERSKFEHIKGLVSAQANARNTLLYASDSAPPVSNATLEILKGRRNRAVALLILTVMIWQKKEEQALVRHAILAFLGVMSKLPEPN